MPHENPLVIDCINRTGGSYLVGNSSDPHVVAEFACKNMIDYAFVNADEPLANGVTDALLHADIKAIGGTKAATRIEWDKIYAMRLMKRICTEYTPFYKIVHDKNQISDAISEFESRDLKMVIKPQGLTGGKGVKVMPEHLLKYDDCASYAEQLLDDCVNITRDDKKDEQGVLFVEKLDGIEFTIMGLTDGKNLVMSPATYDYPYRFEGDCGPGTGGMGCFADADAKLPFMSDSDLADCRDIMQRVLDDMHSRLLEFTGVLNGGFFKTTRGIKFMEFNSRFGDPECLNVLSVLQTPLSEILVRMWDGTLHANSVSFAKKASVNKYLVAKEYPSSSINAIDFKIDNKAVKQLGITVYYASCIRTGNDQYQTLKKSRVVAFSATSNTVQNASDMINDAIRLHVKGDLDYRSDIGSTKSLDKLS